MTKKILVSICNKSVGVNLELPKTFCFEIYPDVLEVRPVMLENRAVSESNGISGLAFYRNGIIGALQSRPVRLLYFNLQYEVKDVWTLNLVRNVHSIAVLDGEIYVASTGNDSVVRFDPDTGEELIWAANKNRKDTIHLNSLVWHEGDLYISAFGEKKGDLWSTADKGFVLNLTTGQKVLTSLYHPHSTYSTNEGIYCCDSSRMAIAREDGQRLVIERGYTRGLVVSLARLYCGVSKGRITSKSTGIMNNPADPGIKAGQCAVLIYERKNHDLRGSKLIGVANLERYGNEIYDILLCDREVD